MIFYYSNIYNYFAGATTGVLAGAAVTTAGVAVASPAGIVVAGVLVEPTSVFSSITN